MDRLEDRNLLSIAVFTLDDTTSSLTLSGTVAGAQVEPQGPGALTTSYEGSIEADYDAAGGTITFTQNTAATANDSGSWEPGINGVPGTAPANYGGMFNIGGTVRAAIRDLVLTAFTDGSLATSDLGGGCSGFSSTQALAVVVGNIDYITPIPGVAGRQALDGLDSQNEAGDGSICDPGNGTLVLSMPIDAPINLDLDVSGQMVPVRLRIQGELDGIFSPGNGGPDSAAPRLDVTVVQGLTGPAATPVFTALPTSRIDSGTLASARAGDALTPAPVAHAQADDASHAVLASTGVATGQALDRAALDLIWNDGLSF